MGRGCDFWVGGAIDTSLGGCDFWVGWYSIGGVRLLGRGCDFWVGTVAGFRVVGATFGSGVGFVLVRERSWGVCWRRVPMGYNLAL